MMDRGLIGATSTVFDAMSDIFDSLPIGIKLCFLASTGLFLIFGFLKMFTD